MRRSRLLDHPWPAVVLIAALAFGTMLTLGRGMAREHIRGLVWAGLDRPRLTGAFDVGRTVLPVPGNAALGAFTADLFYPTEPDGALRQGLSGVARWLARPTQAPSISGAKLASGRPAYPLILYLPSGFSVRDESSYTLAELASHGFVVAAMDDVVRIPVPPGGDVEAQHAILDFTSEDSFARSRRLAARRVDLEARAGSRVIDALAAVPGWAPVLDTTRVGVLGYSFGGGAAAALSRIDPRVGAVANLDGSLYGDAARLGVDVPYLVLFSDTPFHPAEDLTQPDLAARFDAILDQEEIDRQRRDAGRTAHWTFVVGGMRHQDFSDRLIVPALTDWPRRDRAWRSDAWTAVSTVLAGFFGKAVQHDRTQGFELGPVPDMFRSLARAEQSSISDRPR